MLPAPQGYVLADYGVKPAVIAVTFVAGIYGTVTSTPYIPSVVSMAECRAEWRESLGPDFDL